MYDPALIQESAPIYVVEEHVPKLTVFIEGTEAIRPRK